jgi:hypothetical protein
MPLAHAMPAPFGDGVARATHSARAASAHSRRCTRQCAAGTVRHDAPGAVQRRAWRARPLRLRQRAGGTPVRAVSSDTDHTRGPAQQATLARCASGPPPAQQGALPAGVCHAARACAAGALAHAASKRCSDGAPEVHTALGSRPPPPPPPLPEPPAPAPPASSSTGPFSDGMRSIINSIRPTSSVSRRRRATAASPSIVPSRSSRRSLVVCASLAATHPGEARDNPRRSGGWQPSGPGMARRRAF